MEDVTEDGTNFIGVMVGESTPRGIGATDPKSWTKWFSPFFTMLVRKRCGDHLSLAPL